LNSCSSSATTATIYMTIVHIFQVITMAACNMSSSL